MIKDSNIPCNMDDCNNTATIDNEFGYYCKSCWRKISGFYGGKHNKPVKKKIVFKLRVKITLNKTPKE